MRKIVFEIAELELIAIYERPTRIETIQYIWEAMKIIHIEKDDDLELIKLMISAVYKLAFISNEIFQELNVSSYLQDQEDDFHEA